MSGLLIAFEGLDQSGKQTQAERLRDRVVEAGRLVRLLSFPAYDTAIGTEIGRALQGDRDYGPATFWLAELYAKGLGVQADAARAAELRQKVLPTMPVGVRNDFAWELAVSPAAELRDGAFAVEIMERATAERPTPAYIDTLAAAYAEAGRFDDAMRAQQRAIDALPRDASAESRDVFLERLDLYRSGQPYREAP